MNNYIWLEPLFEPVWEHSSSQSKTQSSSYENQNIRGEYKMKTGRIYLQVVAWLVESDYEHNPHRNNF